MNQGGVVLVGEQVRLEPLSFDHVDALVEAAAQNRETYGFTAVPADVAEMTEHVASLLESEDAIPFAQVTDRAVGMTRFLALRRRPDNGALFAVEIGGTWLAASAQRTGLNVEAKLLLLGHAFEVLGVQRVDLKTDARNDRSRTAIAALGATFEGVLRSWQPSHVPGEEHGLRDTAMFSVLATEWPQVQVRLRDRLQRV